MARAWREVRNANATGGAGPLDNAVMKHAMATEKFPKATRSGATKSLAIEQLMKAA